MGRCSSLHPGCKAVSPRGLVNIHYSRFLVKRKKNLFNHSYIHTTIIYSIHPSFHLFFYLHVHVHVSLHFSIHPYPFYLFYIPSIFLFIHPSSPPFLHLYSSHPSLHLCIHLFVLSHSIYPVRFITVRNALLMFLLIIYGYKLSNLVH